MGSLRRAWRRWRLRVWYERRTFASTLYEAEVQYPTYPRGSYEDLQKRSRIAEQVNRAQRMIDYYAERV